MFVLIKGANNNADLKVEYKGTVLAKGKNGKVVKLKDLLFNKSLDRYDPI